jgi:nucleoside-diphosphate-sugar epimerase
VKVLVTGATSLLGGSVAQRLQARGDEVTVLQRRPSGLGVREVLGGVADRRAVAPRSWAPTSRSAAEVTVMGRGRVRQ